MLSDRLLSRLTYSQLEWLRRNAMTDWTLALYRGDERRRAALAKRTIRIGHLQMRHPSRFEDD